MPQEKQEGKGWLVWPGYDAMAARASSAATGSTAVRASSTTSARATTAPSRLATVAAPSWVTSSGVSSGGGWRSDTRIAGHGSAWLVGRSWSTRSASAPDVQPPFPEEFGPWKRRGTISSLVVVLTL